LKARRHPAIAGAWRGGLLGYLNKEPIAWCSLAPSTIYRPLRKDEEPSDDVWSIVCFFIRREHRGQGLTKVLLEAAVQHAKKRGAKVVESYPVDPESPSYRYMGFVPMCKEAGFREVAKAGTRRHVVRLRVA
jgi:GNAT superfamily N-acetyltransferase